MHRKPNIRGLAVVAAGALGVAMLPASASGQCVESVRLGKVFYTGTAARTTLPVGKALEGGVVPGCDDSIVIGPDGKRTDEPPPDTPVVLRRLEGVSKLVAVTRDDDRSRVFVAPGYLVERGHPLATLIGVSDVSGSACSPTVTVRGRAPFRPGIGTRFVVRRADVDTDLVVNRRTRYRGVRRAGLPFVAVGSRLTVTGRRCTVEGQQLLVARHVTIAAP